MKKYFININDDLKIMNFEFDNREIKKNKSVYVKKVMTNKVNDITFDVIKNALTKFKPERKILNDLYHLLKNLSVLEVKESFVNSRPEKYSSSQNEIFQTIYTETLPNSKIEKLSVMRSGFINIFYVSNIDNTINFISTNKEHEAMTLSAAKKGITVLTSLIEFKDVNVEKQIKQLREKANQMTDMIYSKQTSHFCIDIKINKTDLIKIYNDFINEFESLLLMKKGLLKFFNYSKTDNFYVEEFNGFINKSSNKNKSYLYMVKTYNGNVGFLGINIKGKVKNNYRKNYTLTVVKNMSAALIFDEPDYTKCGIGELNNKSYYQLVEVIELKQELILENKTFNDGVMSAFASGIDKTNIYEALKIKKENTTSNTQNNLNKL